MYQYALVIHPNTCSMPIRIVWLIRYPTWRVVRPSMAERRRAFSFFATCGDDLSRPELLRPGQSFYVGRHHGAPVALFWDGERPTFLPASSPGTE